MSDEPTEPQSDPGPPAPGAAGADAAGETAPDPAPGEPARTAAGARPPARPHPWRGVARGFLSVAAVVAAVAVIVVLRGGLGRHAVAGPPAAAAVGQAALPGLQTTAAPWPAEYRFLAQRLTALGLPDLSDTVFHIHAELRVYVDGRRVVVPADVGLPASRAVFSPLHTHDTTGIVHMESTRPYGFTLGDFFDVWGVAFTPTQLGGYRVGGQNTLRVFVNGLPVVNGPGYVMRAHDSIIVGYGPPGSYPTNQPGDFSGGL